MVQSAVVKPLGRQHMAHKDQRSAGQLRRPHVSDQRFQRAVQVLAVGPADTIGNNHGAVGAIVGGQGLYDVLNVTHAQVDCQCRAAFAKGVQVLLVRHGSRFHRGASQDNALRHVGQRQLGLQLSRRRREGGYAGADVIVDTQRI